MCVMSIHIQEEFNYWLSCMGCPANLKQSQHILERSMSSVQQAELHRAPSAWGTVLTGPILSLWGICF